MPDVSGFIPVTPAEYLAEEERTEERLELIDGAIRAMAGGTIRHAVIGTNLVVSLGAGLNGKPCRVFADNVRVAAEDDSVYVYPDATVVCGDLHRSEAIGEAISNPTVVFEVLSPTTEAYDRGRKFRAYATIPSLDSYILVSQDQPAVDVYVRQPDGSWRIQFVTGLDASLHLSIGLDLKLSEIYSDVSFEAEEG